MIEDTGGVSFERIELRRALKLKQEGEQSYMAKASRAMPDNPVKGERTSGWSSTGSGDPQNSGNHLEPSGPPDRMSD
ncbi:uncharacterized protein CPUR_05278 [Claviceps purpurea 20.1]|uniref:Uncharacterized protein n=1 Tax=Claviceps purpurea (strain 20.1) TaxID=1111077 RepID=M1W7Z4_CLAP2|nr:uncharacterized protein CPUR_05278 [Claviceps purpurea 20.1]